MSIRRDMNDGSAKRDECRRKAEARAKAPFQ